MFSENAMWPGSKYKRALHSLTSKHKENVGLPTIKAKEKKTDAYTI